MTLALVECDNEPVTGAELKAARIAAGLTLQRLAALTHLAMSTIQKYERDGVPAAKVALITEALKHGGVGNLPSIARDVDGISIPFPEVLRDIPADYVEIWKFGVLSYAYESALRLANDGWQRAAE